MADTFTIKELLDKIQHKHDHSESILNGELHGDASGSRLKNKFSRGESYANLKDGLFKGSKNRIAVDLVGEIDSLKELKETLDEAGGTGAFKRLAEGKQKELSKLAKNAYRDIGRSVTEYDAAVAASFDQEAKLIKQIDRDAETKVKALASQLKNASSDEIREATSKLATNKKAATDLVREHFKDFRQQTKDVVDDLKEISGDLEKETGISAAEHMKAGAAVVEKEGSALSTLEKAGAKEGSVFKRAIENIKGGSVKASIGSIITLGLGADAIRRAFKLVTGGERNPDGTQQSTAGEIPIIAAETGGALVSLFKLAGHAR